MGKWVDGRIYVWAADENDGMLERRIDKSKGMLVRLWLVHGKIGVRPPPLLHGGTVDGMYGRVVPSIARWIDGRMQGRTNRWMCEWAGRQNGLSVPDG